MSLRFANGCRVGLAVPPAYDTVKMVARDTSKEGSVKAGH